MSACLLNSVALGEALDESARFTVVDHECDEFSPADGGDPGGGLIMQICGSTDSQSGHMTILVRKADGSNFDNRPYQVRVSEIDTDPCGPTAWYYVISNSDPVGVGTPQLVFSFPSSWLANQDAKGYCVTASTQPGDPGYDAMDPGQQSWWYSEKIIVLRQTD